MKNSYYCFFLCLFALVIPHGAIATIAVYQYDDQNRLTQVEIDSTTTIAYTYDNTGNRLTMNAVGNELPGPEVTDTGLYSLDNTLLDLVVSQYGEVYGDLTYEYAIGNAPCTNDVVEWTGFTIQTDGTVQVNDLNLPYGQEYFVCVRIKNYAGEVVSGNGASDGIAVLENHPPFEVFHIHRYEDATQSVSILWDTIDQESYEIYFKDAFEDTFQYAATVSASGMTGHMGGRRL